MSLLFALAVFSLTVISPGDGEVVPTLKDGHKAYFSGVRDERFLRMGNPADRNKLLAIGSTQRPLKLEWSGDTNSVYVLEVDYAEGGALQAFSLTNVTFAYITNLELGRKYLWKVSAPNGDSVKSSFVAESEAPRFLRAGGVGNFRDIGGWKTLSGRRVKENMIFRSAGLRFSSKTKGGLFRSRVELGERRVSDAGIATLHDDFKIKTDLELRTPQETAGMTGTVLGKDVQWQCISFAAYDFIDNMTRGREPFAKIFRLFVKGDNYPFLMHCSGGRDRTGTLAFLLNGLLGVPEDDLCKDWEASVFADNGMSFSSDRIVRLIDYLKTYPGENINSRIEAYAKSCGITDEEISAFRNLMLE